jgi:hypothetical protein
MARAIVARLVVVIKTLFKSLLKFQLYLVVQHLTIKLITHNICCDAPDDGFVDPTSSCDHYHHRDHLSDVPYVDSCHACVKPMDHHHTVLKQAPPYESSSSTAWCHAFSKSHNPSSLCTQAASVAHMQPSSLGKSLHRRKRRAKKKYIKQQRLLRECLPTENPWCYPPKPLKNTV